VEFEPVSALSAIHRYPHLTGTEKDKTQQGIEACPQVLTSAKKNNNSAISAILQAISALASPAHIS